MKIILDLFNAIIIFFFFISPNIKSSVCNGLLNKKTNPYQLELSIQHKSIDIDSETSSLLIQLELIAEKFYRRLIQRDLFKLNASERRNLDKEVLDFLGKKPFGFWMENLHVIASFKPAIILFFRNINLNDINSSFGKSANETVREYTFYDILRAIFTTDKIDSTSWDIDKSLSRDYQLQNKYLTTQPNVSAEVKKKKINLLSDFRKAQINKATMDSNEILEALRRDFLFIFDREIVNETNNNHNSLLKNNTTPNNLTELFNDFISFINQNYQHFWYKKSFSNDLNNFEVFLYYISKNHEQDKIEPFPNNTVKKLLLDVFINRYSSDYFLALIRSSTFLQSDHIFKDLVDHAIKIATKETRNKIQNFDPNILTIIARIHSSMWAGNPQLYLKVRKALKESRKFNRGRKENIEKINRSLKILQKNIPGELSFNPLTPIMERIRFLKNKNQE